MMDQVHSEGTRRPTLRDRFDLELERLGVSCFTLYTEDLWQPGMYIPHEVDTHLYFHETMFAGPLDDFPREVADELTETIGDLRCRFYATANDVPALRVQACHPAYSDASLAPLFSSFLARERVRCSVVFSPSVSVLGRLRQAASAPRARRPAPAGRQGHARPTVPDSTVTELLFLNFRDLNSATRFKDPSFRRSLALLARRMFMVVEGDIRSRIDTDWGPAMLRNLRCQSQISRKVRDDLLSSPSRGAFATTPLRHPSEVRDGPPANPWHIYREFYDALATTLRAELGGPEERMIVAIYACVPDTVSKQDPTIWPHLHCIGAHGRSEPAQKAAEKHLNKQRLYAPSEASVTICTTVTGRSHLLQYVEKDSAAARQDRGGRALTAIELSEMLWHPDFATEANDIAAEHGAIPGTRIFECQASSRPRRLLLEGDLTTEGWIRLEALAARYGIPTFLAQKLRLRTGAKYARIFGALDSEWEHPCSEVCIPIVVGGQILGCVNIESNEPDRFNPSFLNALQALSSTVGIAIMQERRQRLLRCMQTIDERLHASPPVPDGQIEVALDEFAQAAALSLGSVRLDIVGRLRSSLQPFTQLAVSDRGWHDRHKWISPRENGWTDYIVREKRDDFVGVLFVPEDALGDTAKQPAYSAWRMTRSGDARQPTAYEFEEIEGGPSTATSMTSDAPGLVVAVRLGELDQDLPPAVMWCTFAARPFDTRFDRVNRLGAAQRNKYLQYLQSVADHCAVVPALCRSALLAAAEARLNVDHAPLTLLIEAARTRLGRFVGMTAPSTARALVEEAKTTLDTHAAEQRVGERLTITAPGQLRDEYLLVTQPERSARGSIELAWEAAKLASEHPTATLDLLDETDCLRSHSMLVNDDVVHFVFGQLFRNSIDAVRKRRRAGQSASATSRTIRDPVLRLSVVPKHVHNGSPCILRYVLIDNGPGYDKDVLDSLSPQSPERPHVRLAAHGRGLHMVKRLCTLMHVDPNLAPAFFNDRDSGGACSTFVVPATSFMVPDGRPDGQPACRMCIPTSR